MRSAAAALRHSVRRFLAGEGFVLSGSIAYSSLLALFPFVIFLAALASLFGRPETAGRFIATTAGFLPAEVAATLDPVVAEVLRGGGGVAVAASLVLSLWAASSGVEALRAALNHAYGAGQPRPFWLRRLQGLLLVAVAAVAIIVAMTAIVIAPLLWGFVVARLGLPPLADLLWTVARYALAAAALFVGLLLVYRWLPDVHWRWRRHLPGAVLAALLWLGLASSFSLYLRGLADYQVFYGSLAGIVATLFFFFLSAAVVILGAEFNAALSPPAVSQPARAPRPR